MNSNRFRGNQNGASVIFILIILALIGLGSYAGIQYVPQRVESSAVDSILESVQQLHKSDPARDVPGVISTIKRQLNVNQMDELIDSFHVTRNGAGYTINVSYDRELDLLFTNKTMHYEKSIELR